MMFTFYFADDLFLLFEPLITMDSIQFANGTDGRKRRKLYDQSYTHQAIIEYYDCFQKVLSENESLPWYCPCATY